MLRICIMVLEILMYQTYFVLFGCAALIYFVINFTLSCVVRSIQKRNAKVGRPATDSVIDNVNMEC